MPSAPMVLAHAVQVAVLAAVTGAVLACTARRLPSLRLAAWRAVLAAAWLLPLLAVLPVAPAPASPAAQARVGVVALPIVGALEATTGAADHWLPWIVIVLTGGAAARLGQLALGVLRLRRASSSGTPARDELFEDVQGRLGVSARLVWHSGTAQPFTFGSRPAVVVIPAHLASAPDDTRRAIFTHELLHVARRDWRWQVAEELAAAPFWFHPGIALARREMQLAREEIVDSATVAATRARRSYVEMLLSLSERPTSPLAFSLPFLTARQLPRRIAALLSEDPMSIARIVSAVAVVMFSGTAALATAVHAVPLPLPASIADDAVVSQPAPSEPGPLERKAYVAPKDAPPPARLHYVTPALPASAAGAGRIEIELRMILDAAGRVAEARALSLSAPGLDSAASAAARAAVLDAARQWRFAAPVASPLAITNTLTLEVGDASDKTGQSTIERPIPIAIKHAAYPEGDQKAGVEGTATVEITIDTNGRVSATKLVKSTTPAMGDAAIAALKESTFHAGMKDGKAVPVTVTITVRFALK